MTTREEIREGIEKLLEHYEIGTNSVFVAEALIGYLHSQGVAIKVDRERVLGYDNYNDLTRELDDKFETAKVEPLITK